MLIYWAEYVGCAKVYFFALDCIGIIMFLCILLDLLLVYPLLLADS
jgi:hypothetical protein